MKTKSLSKSAKLQTLSRPDFWQHHINQWQSSGLSKAAYCQQHALVYHQMKYWCTKAEKRANETSSGSANFVAVTVTEPMGSSSLSVRLPNGITIEGVDEHSVSLVGRLVKQL